MLGKVADIPVDTGVGSRFQGTGGSRRPRPAFERRPDRAASGATGPHCRTGAPAWSEQRYQWQAAIQRGLKKPVRVSSLREASGRKTGGQPGHPGKTLSRTEAPDATIDHFPQICAGCGAALSEVMAIGPYRQTGVRPSRAQAPGGDRTSGPHLLLPGLRDTNPFGFSRRRHRSDAVWRAARSVRAVSAELPIASREAAGHADGRPFWR